MQTFSPVPMSSLKIFLSIAGEESVYLMNDIAQELSSFYGHIEVCGCPGLRWHCLLPQSSTASRRTSSRMLSWPCGLFTFASLSSLFLSSLYSLRVGEKSSGGSLQLPRDANGRRQSATCASGGDGGILAGDASKKHRLPPSSSSVSLSSRPALFSPTKWMEGFQSLPPLPPGVASLSSQYQNLLLQQLQLLERHIQTLLKQRTLTASSYRTVAEGEGGGDRGGLSDFSFLGGERDVDGRTAGRREGKKGGNEDDDDFDRSGDQHLSLLMSSHSRPPLFATFAKQSGLEHQYDREKKENNGLTAEEGSDYLFVERKAEEFLEKEDFSLKGEPGLSKLRMKLTKSNRDSALALRDADARLRLQKILLSIKQVKSIVRQLTSVLDEQDAEQRNLEVCLRLNREESSLSSQSAEVVLSFRLFVAAASQAVLLSRRVPIDV